MAKNKDGMPEGVRGPGGPPPRSSSGSGAKSAPAGRPATAEQSAARSAFERRSFPFLKAMHSVPRWVMVVLPGALLFLGLVLTGSWAWLGGVLLLIVGVLLAWLTALSWPAIKPGSRILRTIVVVAVFGIAILKLTGRFGSN